MIALTNRIVRLNLTQTTCNGFFQIVHTATYQSKGTHARCYVNQMDVHCVHGDTSAVCAINVALCSVIVNTSKV
jgi:hypothetical protein